MNRKIPKPFEVYRHFKGNHYQILCIAKDAETGEDVAVYQALYGDYAVYARPLHQFLSDVDREKYKDAPQQYRFQEISPASLEGQSSVPQDDLRQSFGSQGNLQQTVPQNDLRQSSASQNSLHQSAAPQDAVRQPSAQSPEGRSAGKLELAEPKPGEADPALLAFLDADTMEEKSNVLVSIRHRITNRLIDDFAVTLDVVIPEGSIDVRYQQLLSSIRMVQKYEIERPR